MAETKAGYLQKKGERGLFRPYKRRFFRICDDKLEYSLSETETTPLGSISFVNVSAVKNVGHGVFEVHVPNRVYQLKAENDGICQEWIAALKLAIGGGDDDCKKLEGYLMKQGGKGVIQDYKQRYFRLIGTRLYYYTKSSDEKPINHICMGDVLAIVSKPPESFEIHTSKRIYFLQASSMVEQKRWVENLKKVGDDLDEEDYSSEVEEELVYFGVFKKNEKGNIQSRIMKVDVSMGTLENISSNSVHRSFMLQDIANVRTSDDNPLEVIIEWKDPNEHHYDLFMHTQRDARIFAAVLRDPSNTSAVRAAIPRISLYAGNLEKQGASGFSTRYCVVSDNTFYCFDDSLSLTPNNVVGLSMSEGQLKAAGERQLSLVYPHRTYTYQAETSVARDAWMEALKRSASMTDALLDEAYQEERAFISEVCSFSQSLARQAKEVYDSENEAHEALLWKLWRALCPGKDIERISRDWGDIGFQGKDPMTDFRGMGLLGLRQLLYIATNHTEEARRMALRPGGYPFAIAGIGISRTLLDVFRIRKMANPTTGLGNSGNVLLTLRQRTALPAWECFLSLHRQCLSEGKCETEAGAETMPGSALDRMYVVYFRVLDQMWTELRAGYMDFPKVRDMVDKLFQESLIARPHASLRRFEEASMKLPEVGTENFLQLLRSLSC
eukprot:Rmarinus@m.8290